MVGPHLAVGAWRVLGVVDLAGPIGQASPLTARLPEVSQLKQTGACQGCLFAPPNRNDHLAKRVAKSANPFLSFEPSDVVPICVDLSDVMSSYFLYTILVANE